ncbi:MAG: PucR family transcriptional regulator [Lachnospiraceae bacterium]
MNVLQLIRHLEQIYDIEVFSTLPEDLRIDSILFYSDDHLIIQKNTLYLAQDTAFAEQTIPEERKELPLLLCGGSEPSELHIANFLHISSPVPLTALYNSIQELLYEILQANLKKEELFHILQAGYGLQVLLDTASSFLGQPVTLCSTSYSILCQSPKDTSSRHFIEHNSKKFITMGAIQNMQTKNVSDQLMNTATPFLMNFDDEPDKDFIFCGVKIHQLMIGYLCVESNARLLSETGHQFIADLSKIISVEMQKDDFFKERSGSLQDYLLIDLIERTITSEDFARHRMETLGLSSRGSYQLLVCTFVDADQKHLVVHHYLEQLASFFDNAPCSSLDHNFVVLLSGTKSECEKKVSQHRFLQFLKHNRLLYSVSCHYPYLLQTNLYYKQACYMIDTCKSKTPGTGLSYDDFRLRHIFSMAADPQLLAAALHPDIRLLRDFDQGNRTEYFTTIKTYLEQNRNAQQAAKALNIHKSTFFYRLDKIKEFTSFSLEDSSLLLQYEISFQLMNYLDR